MLSKKIELELLDPRAYPEPSGKIELIQTHISFVFLTDTFVYKVKKPVNFGFLDFSTLDKRRYYCEREVVLNKRLSPDVYLGVLPVTDEGNKLMLAGSGPVVDYAVKMRRLPMNTLMLTLLKERMLTPEMIERVSKKLASFHAVAETGPEIELFGSLETIRTNTDENFVQTEKYIGQTISRAQFEQIKNYVAWFYQERRDIIQKRIYDRKIRDCHGDLHMEHICIADDIIIFDCIEFNDRFRYSDTAADIAFLVMDLEFHGAKELAQILVDTYVAESGDIDIHRMLNFYKCYRAYVRGKVLSFRLDDTHISAEDKVRALETAKKYFELAESYAMNSKSR